MTLLPTPTPCAVPEEHYALFLSGALQRESKVELLEHLLAGCERCRSSVRFPGPGAAGSGADVTGVLRRLAEQASSLDHEWEQAAELLPAFLKHPVERQRTIVAHQAKYATYAFVEALVEASFEEIYDRPARTAELLDIAQSLLGRLDTSRYSPRILNDLRARVEAHRANAHRTFGRLADARGDLARARRASQEGSLDPLSEAEILYFEGVLLFAERRPDAALEVVRRARRLYEQFGQPESVGLCWNAECGIVAQLGDNDAALFAAETAIKLVDPGRAPRLAAAARHNYVWHLIHADRLEEAEAKSVEYTTLFDTFGDGPTKTKFEWRRGQLHERRGEFDAAEAVFRRVHDELAELEMPIEAAVASLDLSLILLRQGRYPEVREVSAQTLALFRSLGVEREAIAAWLVFKKAADAEALSRDLVERLAAYLRMAKVRPGVPFEG